MLQTISSDMLLLGVVKEVRDLEIVLNLPGGSTGFLAITDISDIYTKHLEELSQGDVDSNEEVGHVCATLGGGGRGRFGDCLESSRRIYRVFSHH